MNETFAVRYLCWPRLVPAVFFILLGGGMLGCISKEAAKPAENTAPGKYWTCAMHPQLRQAGPGACPLCGMDLLVVREGHKESKP
jgi:membrane fusion protein, copper/silver efflux system